MKTQFPIFQGLYYLVTGIWPILHVESFMAVTGPKIDIWLVKMVALLSITIGLSILAAQRDHYKSFLLNGMAALSFLIIDTYYSLIERISAIYLADALVQLFFLIMVVLSKQKIKESMQVLNSKKNS